jgi:precorrin-6B methylase 2
MNILTRKIRKIIDRRKAKKALKAKRRYKRHFLRDTISARFSDLIVKNGPFKGMHYPSAASAGSPLLPKLIGSYESELNDVVEKIIATNYAQIIDIGCAEGYYAVGLALRIPQASIYAFDTDPIAIESCRQMLKANNVDESRISLEGFCDTETLMNFEFSDKAIIISDCEGYEKVLFTAELAERLKEHDLLIETHDVIDMEISTQLHSIFSKTHDIEIIFSVDDVQKAKTYHYAEVEDFDLNEKRLLFAERRACVMEWFYITARPDGVM